jgi:pilus assembly protein CpaB
MKGKKLLLLSLVLALAAAGMVYRYLADLEAEQKRASNLVPVLVPRSEIPARSKLDESMFMMAEIPSTALHADALADRDEISGAFARDRLLPGEQVLASRLVYTGSGSGMSYRVSPGHRALTLAVNTVSGVAGYVLPGDRVDILMTLEVPESGDEDTTLTLAVVENIGVLAVGPHLRDQSKEQLPVDNITFDVPAAQVTRLVQAAERGSIRLVLRPADEETTGNLPSHLLKQFYPGRNP